MASVNGKRVSVSVVDFVKAWQGSTSVEEAAGKLGYSPMSAYIRYTKLAKEFAGLKKMTIKGESKLTTIKAVKSNADALAMLAGLGVTLTPAADAAAAADTMVTTIDTPAPKGKRGKVIGA